ncbi:MAG: hypothetical protein LBE16_07180 [Clostridiales Family XIII bacterium]|jgi:hypothetical protein|nr:hypothetical protein [Clostridiales Family XIII bacterium]
MQLTILGILALGGGILLIYLALNRRPAAAERTRRPRSGDGKVIYLFGDRVSGEAAADADAGDKETPDAAEGECTDAEFSEADTERPDDDEKE